MKQINIAATGKQRIEAYQAHLERITKDHMKFVRQRLPDDSPTNPLLIMAESYRIEAEYWVEKAKGKDGK